MHMLKIVLILGLASVQAWAWCREASPVPVGQRGEWRLVFSDEFDTDRLDLRKWRPNWLGPDDQSFTKPVNVEEVSCYDPSQVRLTEGELRLVAESRACGKWNYASGLIQSNGRFNFTYGYAEARMWMPKGAGVWPAFWLNGQRNPQDGEIDVVEASGDDAGRFHFHYQCGEKRCAPGGNVRVDGATSGWHTYAVRWTPDSIVWFYDGKPVYSRHEALPVSPHYLILNLGLRQGTTDYPLPATLRVDYIRVWQED